MGWDYALGWLTVLPFEITAAGITISFWKEINIGVWIAVFLFLLCVVQIFGVRGYGESESSRSYELAVIQWLTSHVEQSNSFSAVSKSQPSLGSSFSPSLLTLEVSTPKQTVDTLVLITGTILARSKTALRDFAPSSSMRPLLSVVLSLSVSPLLRPLTRESHSLPPLSKFFGA